MGGYERFENMLVWDEFLRLSGGAGQRVAVLAAASAEPENYSHVMALHLQRLGLIPVVIAPDMGAASDFRRILDQPEWIAAIENADAVFLLGGDQSRYCRFLLKQDGSDTRMLQAIRSLHRRGGLIAGTSAGTAVMSAKMFVDGQLPFFMLQQGTQIDKEIGQGFAFLPAEWFVDQHFLVRGRLARTLVAMQRTGFKYALGIDEDTAISIDARGQARVVGHSGVLVIDASHAHCDARIHQFNWRDLRLSYLSHGDQLDLNDRAIKVADQKQREYKLVPQGASGESPASRRVHYDVFSQSALSRLMLQSLKDSTHTTLGLCLNPNASLQSEEQPGFQLQLKPTPESVAWEGAFVPGDPLSVLNIGADLKPVRIKLSYEEIDASKP